MGTSSRRTAGLIALIAITVAASVWLHSVGQGWGRRDGMDGLYGVLFYAGVLGCAVFFFGRWRWGWRLSASSAIWIVPAAVVLFALWSGVQLGNDSAHALGGYIHSYCAYGSVSDAQLEGCTTHVTEGTINRLDTNAARFAKGKLSQCLSDSGPFCEDEASFIGLSP